MRKYVIRIGLLLLMLIFGITCGLRQESEPADIMYFILIDRFVDGDSTNNSGNNPESYLPYDGSNPHALKYYQGGDLVGITKSLDRLKAMGITMIWISPFLDNSNTDYVGWWPYHGYHPIDFYQVDEHFGNLDDLKTLVNTAHENDMKVIFDMPFNQTAADHPWLEDETKKDWYHLDDKGQPYAITNWFDQEQIEEGELHGLPDLAQENPAVEDYLLEVSKYWIEQTGCDGFRLDAVKHIPQGFWESYNSKIRAFAGEDFLLLGEVFWGEIERITPYADLGFDMLFDLPGYYAIRNTFNKGGSFKDFSDFYQKTSDELPGVPFATIIDNHDVARFNVDLGTDAWDKQLMALGWLMTAPGMPVIYTGTELGMEGYHPADSDGNPQDYLNRLPYPSQLSSEAEARVAQFSELTALRQEYPALVHGSFTEIYKDWSVYAFLRILDDELLCIVLNNASTDEFLAIPKPAGIHVDSYASIYGNGVLREEASEWHVRLQPNTLSVWRFDGRYELGLSERTSFTNRLSKDYRLVQLFYSDPDAAVKNLQVAGDFNNWVPGNYTNRRSGDTVFIELPLKPGNYEYKLVVNGSQWLADPAAVSYVSDPYGSQNSVLVVSSD